MESKTVGQSEQHHEACVLWRAGDISVSEALPEEFKNIYITAARFETPSERKAVDTVITRIKALERGLGVKFRLATWDFPLFVPILAGRYEGADDRDREFRFHSLPRDPDLFDAREALCGITLDCGSLALTEHGTIVLRTKIPLDMFGTLDRLAEIYQHRGLVPLRRNRFEITVGRVVQYPTNEWLRNKLVEELDFYLRHDLSNRGLPLVTSNETVNGCPYDFLA